VTTVSAKDRLGQEKPAAPAAAPSEEQVAMRVLAAIPRAAPAVLHPDVDHPIHAAEGPGEADPLPEAGERLASACRCRPIRGTPIHVRSLLSLSLSLSLSLF
jgi:hypothetical protein